MNKSSTAPLHRTLLLALLCSFPLTSLAQTQQLAPLKLSLEDAIATSQMASPRAKAIRAAYEANKWQYKSFQASQLPQLTMSGNAPTYSRSITPITQPDGSILYRTQEFASPQGSVNLVQPLIFSGGQLTISSGVNLTYNLADNFAGNRELWQTTPFEIGLNQPLFQFNPWKWDLKIQPVRIEIAQINYNEGMEDLALEVARAYYDTYIAQMSRENAAFNVAVNDTIFRISKGRFNVGNIAENELLQTELALLNAQSSYQNAQLDYERSKGTLRNLLGIGDQLDIQLDPILTVPDVIIDVTMAKKYAYDNSSQLKQFEIQKLEAERNYDQTKRQNSFNANLNARYGFNAQGTGFADAYDPLLNRTIFSVGVQVPLFNWGQQDANIKAANERRKEVQNNIINERDRFEQNVDIRLKQFQLVQNNLKVSEKSDQIASRRYDVARNRFLIGKISITDLQIAQGEKDNARIGYIRALREYWLALYEIRRMTLYDFLKNAPVSYY